MKNYLLTGVAFALLTTATMPIFAQKNTSLRNAIASSYSKDTKLPNVIQFNQGEEITSEQFTTWASTSLNLPKNVSLKAYNVVNDDLGFTHTRYKEYVANYPIEGTMLITHISKGKIKSVNGDYFQALQSNYKATISEAKALQYALFKINATHYRWQGTGKSLGRDRASYYPKGELVVVHKQGASYAANTMRLAYKFNIYAETPLYKANVCIDAQTGEFLAEEKLIHTADVVGTANTKYSGNVAMTCNNVSAGQYELQETARGNGIKTRNQANTTSGPDYAFTSTSSNWTTTGVDQAATDAHWGAEKTYDYFSLKHSRNSIDDGGFELISYVHYDVNLVNAFWDGQEMVYGDGNGSSFGIMTGLDICGHEITHGLVTFTAGLNGGEAGALNEAFADIFGTSVEAYARTSQHDWLMGADVTPSGGGLRNMADPQSYGDPDTYLGTYWDPAGEVHKNATPATYWYYLLCQGGTGTNDLNNTYTVAGITMAKAEKIAFRGLTNYFTPSTSYTDARTYTIQAATDLYGACSAELQATTNAWYAVGVGAAFAGSVATPAFTANTVVCALPANIQFTNTSIGATSYSWDFGDGSAVSTVANPTHTYNTGGSYTVTLTASSTGCGSSSSNVATQTITLNTVIAAAIPVTEGFETSTSLPNAWAINNPDNDAAWQISSTVAKTGTNSIGFNNCNGNANADMTGKRDKFYTATYNFSGTTTPSMTFDVGYATISSGGIVYADTLVIYASTDCGTTWNEVYHKGGAGLASAPNVVAGSGSSACWTPSASQWRNDAVNLTAFAGQANVMFAFENRSGWGQWLFLDNINISNTTTVGDVNLANKSISIYPNPANNILNLNTNTSIQTLAITNLLGQTIIAEQKTNSTTHNIDIATLTNGVYLLKIKAVDNTTSTIKFIKE